MARVATKAEIMAFWESDGEEIGRDELVVAMLKCHLLKLYLRREEPERLEDWRDYA